MKLFCWMTFTTVMFFFAGSAGVAADPCRKVQAGEAGFLVCTFDPGESDIRLFHRDRYGEVYGNFGRLAESNVEDGLQFVFGMNAGMYHRDRMPVGAYAENYVQITKANTNPGPGNFHLKPNGIFWVWSEDGHRGVQVSTTEDYLSRASRDIVKYATQSGPMLVIDGEIHPKFIPDSISRKRRNGVGVTADGTVIFVISEGFVTFYEFACFFRDDVKAVNALFLDGTVSKIYAPDIGRNDVGIKMGPIISVVSSLP